jgi:hypothetical protein
MQMRNDANGAGKASAGIPQRDGPTSGI